MSIEAMNWPPRLSETEAEAVYQLSAELSRDGKIYCIDSLNFLIEAKPLSLWNPQTEPGFIRLKDEYTAGDFDKADGLEKARKLESQCPYPCHVFHSGGANGRAHLIIQTERKKQRDYWIERIKAEGGDHRTDCAGLRPPGALHRSGKSRSSSTKNWSIEDVLQLFKTGQRPKKQPKAAINLESLAAEYVPLGYRSTRLYSLAAEAVNIGLGYESFVALIERHPEGAASKIADRTPKQKAQYLRNLWLNASDGKDTGKSTGWIDRVLSHPEIQASRLNMIAVVLEIGKLSRFHHGRTFHLSQRSLADRLNRSATAARKAIQLLVRLGFLIVRGAAKAGRFGNTYDLGFSQKETTQSRRDGRGCRKVVGTFGEFAAHDSLSGRNGMALCWGAMSPVSPLIPIEIAARSGRAVKTVYRHLKSMMALGLAVKVGNGFIRIEDPAAHRDAAQMRGTDGRGERRKQIHALQRNGWREERQRRFDALAQQKRRDSLKDQIQSKESAQNADAQAPEFVPEIEDTEPLSNFLCPLRL